MAEQEFIYRLDIDTSGTQTDQARASLESLKRKILETEGQAAKLRKEMKDGTKTIAEAAGPLSQYESRLKALRTTYQETQRAATGLQGFTEKIGAQFKTALGPIEGMLGKLGPLGDTLKDLAGKGGIAGQGLQSATAGMSAFGSASALAVTGVLAVVAVLVSMGAELFSLSQDMELTNKRAEVLFGDAFPQMTAAASENANQIGLTTNEYLKLASSLQTTFTALGLTADQTSDLIPEIINMSDALADFSGGALDTAQATEVLQAAFQGNTKGLAQFGLPVKLAKDELDALAKQLQETNGYTEDQARSLASYQLIIEQIGPELNKFNDGQETMQDTTDRAAASFRQLKEELAEKLTPAFQYVTKAAGGFLDVLTQMVKGDVIGEAVAKAKTFASLTGNDEQVKALQEVERLYAKAGETIEKNNRSIEKNITFANAQRASYEEVANSLELQRKKQQELLDIANSQKEGSIDQAATLASLKATEKNILFLERTLILKGKDKEATTEQGDTYETLQKQLQDLQDARKNLNENDAKGIEQNNKDIASVKERLKAFDETEKKTKDVVTATEKYTEAVKKLNLEYEVSQTKINELAQAGLVTEEQRQRRLLELETKTAEQRLKLREDLALSDGTLTDGEKEEIIKLTVDADKAKQDLEAFDKQVEKATKDREVIIDASIKLDEQKLNKEIADAISFAELEKAFDDAFASAANELGDDVRKELLAAAKDGTLNTDGLINLGVNKELIGEIQAAYEKFVRSTEVNELELVKAGEQKKLNDLTKQFNELTRKKAEAEVNVDVQFTEEDKAVLDQVTDKVKQQTVFVNTIQGKIDGAKADTSGTTKKGDGKGTDEKLGVFGLDQETLDLALEVATSAQQTINETLFSLRRQQIEQSLAITESGLQAESEARINILKNQLEQGLITEQEFQDRSKASNAKYQKELFEARKKAFNEEKKIKRAEVTISYALEVAKTAAATASQPWVIPALLTLATARYFLNLATIDKQQIAKRGAIASTGMVAQGPKHEQGGIPAIVGGSSLLELEGGEAIINARSTAAFLPQLSAINSFGGWGQPFRNGGVARKFATGGISMVPDTSVVASMAALDASVQPKSQRVVKLAGEEQDQRVVVYLDELSAKTSRLNRSVRRVSYGD